MNTTLIAGFKADTGQQVSVLRLREGQAMPAGHMKSGIVYGFYREQDCVMESTGKVLIPAGSLMMACNLSDTDDGFDPPEYIDLGGVA